MASVGRGRRIAERFLERRRKERAKASASSPAAAEAGGAERMTALGDMAADWASASAQENEVLSVVQGIGAWVEGPNGRPMYEAGEECIECIDDLRRALRHEDSDTREAFLTMGKFDILRRDLLPLLRGYQDSPELIFHLLGLLEGMTRPAVPGSETYEAQMHVLRRYRDALMSSDVLAVLMLQLAEPMEREEARGARPVGAGGDALLDGVDDEAELRARDQSKRDRVMMELVLRVVCNLLHVPAESEMGMSGAAKASLKYDAFIEQLAKEDVLEAVVVIAQETGKGGLYREWRLLVLEILALIFRGRDPAAILRHTTRAATHTHAEEEEEEEDDAAHGEPPVASRKRVRAGAATPHPSSGNSGTSGGSSSNGGSGGGGALAALLQKEKRNQMARSWRNVPTRHSRFGGVFRVTRADGSSFHKFSNVLKKEEKYAAKKKSKVRARGKKRTVVYNTPTTGTRTAYTLAPALHALAEQLIDHALEPLSMSLMASFRRDGDVARDVGNFFTLSTFLLAFHRERALREGSPYEVAPVACLVDEDAFRFVQRQVETELDQFHHYAITCGAALLKEMLLHMRALEATGDANKRLVHTLYKKLFFEDEFRRLFPHMLTRKDMDKRSLAHRADVALLADMALRTVEGLVKEKAMFVAKQRRSRAMARAARRRANTGEGEDDDVARELGLAGEGDGTAEDEAAAREELEAIKDEVAVEMTDAHVYVKLFAKTQALRQCIALLQHYRDNSDEVNAALVRIMRRVHDDLGLQAMFYQASMLILFGRIVHDPVVRGNTAFAPLIKFIKDVLAGMFELMSKNKLLAVEALFWKMPGEAEVIQSCYENGVSRAEARAAERDARRRKRAREMGQPTEEESMWSGAAALGGEGSDGEGDAEFVPQVSAAPADAAGESTVVIGSRRGRKGKGKAKGKGKGRKKGAQEKEKEKEQEKEEEQEQEQGTHEEEEEEEEEDAPRRAKRRKRVVMESDSDSDE